MNIQNKAWRTIWVEQGGHSIGVINQTKLPHEFLTCTLSNYQDVVEAIKTMKVRGAPLIGVAGAYGLMLAIQEDPDDSFLELASSKLLATRPTAVNLLWALTRVLERVKPLSLAERAEAARLEADLIAEEDVAMCEAIGVHGCELIQKLASARPVERQKEPLNLLTHCNAGWLATVDWGTALAPIYKAHRAGVDLHVWVDETRPRNQGASLTAYELSREGIPHTLIVDNAGGYLMQHGYVDAVIVGADRVTRSGDVCNKIGTYLKALAAQDNDLPFYVAIPSSTIDWSMSDGVREIPIEIRSPREITHIDGCLLESAINTRLATIQISPSGTKGFNPAFDITPSRLVSALITERGVTSSREEGLKKLFPDLSNGQHP